jgi:hypothetical protein
VVFFGGDAEFDSVAWCVKRSDECFSDRLFGRRTPCVGEEELVGVETSKVVGSMRRFDVEDGTFNGRPVPEGVYFVSVKAGNQGGLRGQAAGAVHVFR